MPTAEEEEERKKGGGTDNRGSRLGSAADRAGRRAKRSERATDRRVTSPVPASALLSDEEESRRGRGGRKPRGQHRSRPGAHPQVPRRDRAAHHRPRPLRGHRRQGQRPAPQAHGHEPDDDHQRHPRRRAGHHALHGVRHRAPGGPRALDRGGLLRRVQRVDRPRRPAPAAAGDHHPRPRRPRQDLAAGPDPQGERRRFRERRHHPAHRRLPGRVRGPARSRSSTPPATRRSPPCGPAAPT